MAMIVNCSVLERKKRSEKVGGEGVEGERENERERKNTKGNRWIPKCLVYDFLLFLCADFFHNKVFYKNIMLGLLL